jgi:tRNA(His) guanylyltransferase
LSTKLSDRIEEYLDRSDLKLLSRVPIIICINGRAFAKATQLLDKPYCPKFSECMLSTMVKLCTYVEGAMFAYQHNDEIILITRNDQNSDTHPWYDNKIQKICSVTASIASLHFNECAAKMKLNIPPSCIFTSQIFEVPNIAEAINTFIYKQQQNFHTSIQSACLYNLLNNHDKNSIKDMLTGLDIDGKIDLLSQECKVNFNDYPLAFRRGVAAYKVPKIVDGVMKHKWHINSELPIFTRDQSFLSNIFKNGMDIFRGEGFDE